MKRLFFKFLLIILFLSQFLTAQVREQIVIFLDESPVSDHFREETLPKIDAYAKDKGIALIIQSTSDGAPEDITFAPSIFFQNHLGRSRYVGRYSTTDRLINFIRTAKNTPRPDAKNKKKSLPVFQIGKATIGTPVKVTPLSGNLPEGFDQEAFIQESRRYIFEGFQDFTVSDTVSLPAEARLFYTDYHPFLDEKGTLHISTEIYSMFHCEEPVSTSNSNLSGPWENRKELFKQIARKQEKQVQSLYKNLRNGDAFSPLTASNSVLLWEDLGLQLPKKKRVKSIVSNLDVLPKNWTFSSSLSDDSPILQFNFGSPLDYYSGEAKELKMKLNFKNSGTLLGAKGHIIVNPRSITMGDKGLDSHILSAYLKAKNYPNSSFKFEIVEAPSQWNVGSPQKFLMKGVFEMIGRPIPMEVEGILELTANDKGNPILRFGSNFKLPLKKAFGISGPEGPSPAKDELNFYLNFLLKSTNQSTAFTNDLYEATEEKIIETKSKVETEENYIRWKASNRIYKARGSFKTWYLESKILNSDFSKINSKLVVEIESLSERSKLLVKHLKAENFFNAKEFPFAEIIIKGATLQANGKYRANASATIKGITDSISVEFEVVNPENKTIKGTAIINREKFRIGTSKKSKGISKDVSVNFLMKLN